ITRLVKPDGSAATTVAEWIKYELLDVSDQPGVCMNFPPPGRANTHQDFRFQQLSNFPPYVPTYWNVTSESSMQALFGPTGPLNSAEGILCCYDFGAYARLKVTAKVNGNEIVAYRKGDQTKDKSPNVLPKRVPGSFIADQWKQDNHVAGKTDD